MENEHYALIIACLADPGNAEKQQALDRWLAASDINRALFEEVKMLWKAAGSLPATSLDQAAGWEALSEQLLPAPLVRTRRIAPGWWKAAAVLLPLLIAAGYWFYHTNRNSRIMYTAKNAKDSLLLPDGSAVYLQQGARVSWIRSFEERSVQMESGEAFFKIVKNGQHTFSITAANATVKVLGTAFNVKTNAAATDVVVWEGKVSLDGSKSEPVILGPGEMGVAEANTGKARKLQGNYKYRCGWANDDLVFYNQPLDLVLRVFEAHYHTGGPILNPKLLNRRVTVRFRHLKAEDALNVLNALLDDELSKQEDTLSH